MNISNAFINAEAPPMTATQTHIAAEITEPLMLLAQEQINCAVQADILLTGPKGHFLKSNDKKYITVGIPLRRLDPAMAHYSHIIKSAKGLRGKYFIIEGKDVPFVTDVQPFEPDENLGNSGVIEIDISRKIIPYLLAVQGGYTPNLEKNVFINGGKYTGRLYMLMMQFAHDGFSSSRVFELTDLRNKLGIPADKYKGSFRDFSKKVLDEVQKDLADTTCAFDWAPHQKGGANGKEVKSIIFTLKNKGTRQDKTDNTLKSNLRIFYKRAMEHTPIILTSLTGAEILRNVLLLFEVQR